jgi:hypothetical protein
MERDLEIISDNSHVTMSTFVFRFGQRTSQPEDAMVEGGQLTRSGCMNVPPLHKKFWGNNLGQEDTWR